MALELTVFPTAFAYDDQGVEIVEGHALWPEVQRRRARQAEIAKLQAEAFFDQGGQIPEVLR